MNKLIKLDCDIEGYSIYKNHNKTLVEKIKNVKVKKLIEVGDDIHDFAFGPCVVSTLLDNGEVLVLSKVHNRYKVLTTDHDALNTETVSLKTINETYSVNDYFIENFGLLTDGREIITGLHMVSGETGVSVTGTKTTHIETSFNRSFSIKINSYYGSGAISFNTDGNYLVRDYNHNFANYTQIDNEQEYKKKRIKDFLNEIKETLPDELMTSGNTWFSSEFAYKLHMDFGSLIYIDKIPNQGNKYYHSGDSRSGVKLPKKYTTVNRDEMISSIVETKKLNWIYD